MWVWLRGHTPRAWLGWELKGRPRVVRPAAFKIWGDPKRKRKNTKIWINNIDLNNSNMLKANHCHKHHNIRNDIIFVLINWWIFRLINRFSLYFWTTHSLTSSSHDNLCWIFCGVNKKIILFSSGVVDQMNFLLLIIFKGFFLLHNLLLVMSC